MELQEMKKQMKWQEWSQMVTACRNSGMKIKDWCEQNEINLKTYYYRQRRVFDTVKDTSLVPSRPKEAVEFAPLRPEHRHVTNAVTLHLSDCTLEIPEGYDHSSLRAIIQAIREC